MLYIAFDVADKWRQQFVADRWALTKVKRNRKRNAGLYASYVCRQKVAAWRQFLNAEFKNSLSDYKLSDHYRPKAVIKNFSSIYIFIVGLMYLLIQL